MSLRLVLPALTVAALLGGPALAAGPYPPPAVPDGQIVPSRIEVGGCATFSGDGFSARTEIVVRDDGQSAGSTTTDDQGSFSKQMCFRSDARTSTHVITGTGLAPAQASRSTAQRGSSRIAAAEVLRTVSVTLVVTGVSQTPGVPVSGSDGGSVGGPGTDGQGGNGTGVGLPRSGVAAVALGLAGVGLVGSGAAILLLTERRHRAHRRLRRLSAPA